MADIQTLSIPQKKHSIRNPEKWLGKYVRHMANWMDYQWPHGLDDTAEDDYFVCEWTGKLTRICDQAHWSDGFETLEAAQAAGYDECYYYCLDAIRDMQRHAKRAPFVMANILQIIAAVAADNLMHNKITETADGWRLVIMDGCGNELSRPVVMYGKRPIVEKAGAWYRAYRYGEFNQQYQGSFGDGKGVAHRFSRMGRFDAWLKLQS